MKTITQELPAQSSFRTLPQQAPAVMPRTLVCKLPTLEALAGLAAIMATPKEAPAATAYRAMELLAACERELGIREKIAAKEAARIKLMCDVAAFEQEFLSNFIEGENLRFDSLKPGETVTVGKFLETCMPRSKDVTRMKKWEAFIANRMSPDGGLPGICDLDESQIQKAAASVVARFAETGIPASLSLAKLRDMFLEFLDADARAIKAAKARKSIRMKPIYETVRKHRDGEGLTPEETSLLTNLTSDEVQSVIDKFDMDIKEAGTWKAAIEDLKTPAKGRPRERTTAVP